MERPPSRQTSRICLLSIEFTLGPSWTSDQLPVSRGGETGTLNKKLTGLGAQATLLAAICLHFKISVIIVGSPVQPSSHRKGGSKGPVPESPFQVSNSSSPQPRTYSRSGWSLLGLQPRTCQGPSLEGSESRSEVVAAKTKAWTPQEAPLQSPVLTSALSVPAGLIHSPRGRYTLLFP